MTLKRDELKDLLIEAVTTECALVAKAGLNSKTASFETTGIITDFSMRFGANVIETFMDMLDDKVKEEKE